jgi:hypothetical protein
MNLRAGYSTFHYSGSFAVSGTQDIGTLKLSSIHGLIDVYPFGHRFHLSAGALVHDANRINASFLVPGGSSFTLRNLTVVSDPADPIHGRGSLRLPPFAPMLLAGWGNIVPRSRHVSFPLEAGVVFQGPPTTGLDLAGNVCGTSDSSCLAFDQAPGALANLRAEQSKLNDEVRPYRYYPVISMGVAYRFPYLWKP